MAYVSGTATDYNDLLARLESFLTTNPTLVGSGHNWTTLRYSNGPGAQAFPFGRIAFGSTLGGTVLDLVTGAFPSSNFKMKISGTITIPVDGTYIFAVDSKDASEILVDGDVVVGWYGSHAMGGNFSHNESVPLLAGTYQFEARIACAGAAAYGLAVGWQAPGDGSISTIPGGVINGLQMQVASQVSVPGSGSEMSALWAEKELIIKAPGMPGTDNIYIGIQPFQNVAGDYYNWELRGFGGYNPSEFFATQPVSSTPVYGYLWNAPIPYWFIANGQRVIIVAKVSTSYQVMYLGKMLPYGLPAQYPYPVVISGSDDVAAQRWSTVRHETNNFQRPGNGTRLFYVDGTWRMVRNVFTYSSNLSWDGAGSTGYNIHIWPRQEMEDTWSLPSSLSWPNNGFTLLPFIINSASNTQIGGNVLGEMDGAYWVSGHQNTSENIITVGGDSYLCVQNINRTGVAEYMAVRLV